MANDEQEYYEMLLDEVAWSFAEDAPQNIEDFHSEIIKYNEELDLNINDDFTYSIAERIIKISFDYYYETENEWIKTRK